MTPASMTAKRDPNSALRRFFTMAVNKVEAFLEFINEVTLEELQSFWGRRR